jgi:ketosteroid isomerase-like protein
MSAPALAQPVHRFIVARLLPALLMVALGGCATAPLPPAADLAAQVRAAETAFAKTMADRDFAAFSAWLADDAVFVNGGQPLRGKPAVLAHWKKFFDDPAAPFAWKPEIAEVSGGLGYTEGPVSAPDGKVFARFWTTWRRDPVTGQWRVAFDNGQRVCDCPK